MGSLSHSVVFHVLSEELLFRGDGEDEWWIQEAWTPRSGQGRGMHESWIWSPKGVHVATTWQGDEEDWEVGCDGEGEVIKVKDGRLRLYQVDLDESCCS